MTRLPLTIGDDTPSPASGAFHATFSVALHFSGSFVSGVVPVPAGPRHDGQSAALTDTAASIASTDSTPASIQRTRREVMATPWAG